MKEKIVFVGATRSPIGAIGGSLSSIQAQPLATTVIKNLIEQSGIDPDLIEYTALGWVIQDPRSPNIAKTAAELAGVPSSSPGTTLHENCNSGGAAIHTIARRLLLGEIKIGIAGGVESMSNVARYLYAGRLKGQLYGDMGLTDGLFGALTDTYVNKGELMGLLTERLTQRYKLTREEQDEIAFRSHHNALSAWDDGSFSDYVKPVEVKLRRKTFLAEKDEGPRDISMQELQNARPYFKKEGGTITTLNASSMNDAAAMLLMTTLSHAKSLGLKPLAELRSFTNIGVPREYMGEGAFKVIPKLLKNTNLQINDVDFYEINEAFAAVLASAYKDLPDLKIERTNLWGSGISLGHPVGATGARQVVDMIWQLQRRNKETGVTSRCVGGGMGGAELIAQIG